MPRLDPLLSALTDPAAWADVADHVTGGSGGALAELLVDLPRDPHLLGALHARTRDRGDRLAGVYTPPEVAARIVREALRQASGAPTVLDPACGGGVFLVEAARALWSRTSGTPDRLAIVRRHLRGWDVDPGAVAVSRLALAAAAGAPGADLSDVVVVRDALAPCEARFDLVVGNPPWIDASAQVAVDPARRAELTGRFTVARGAWDLFCVFVERALQLLAPGGVHAFVVPDRLATAPYAAAARRLLHGGSRRLAALWVEDDDTFAAAVRAVAYVSVSGDGRDVPLTIGGRTREVSLGRDGERWSLPEDADDEALVAILAGLPPLASYGEVCGAATVAEAYALGDALAEGAPGAGWLTAVNTGTIDPLRSLWGERPLRYLGRRLLRPVVDEAALPARRRAQARQPKVIVGGIGRRLEPLADLDGGIAALKSTALVLPSAPGDVAWLAGWLASDVASRAWRVRFGGLRLRGGYLRIGPPELSVFPVPPLDRADRDALAALVRRLVAAPADPVAWIALNRLAGDVLGLAPPPPG